MRLLNGAGHPIETRDAVRDFANRLRAGRIGALKGLGGYHLACDAANERAVAELRRRKGRDDKPLALMVADVERAARLCAISAAERRLLTSSRRPIVLLRRKPIAGRSGAAEAGVAEAVAAGNPYLGLMLPYTPLHHLLLDAAGGGPLVMTSGNRSDEPIAYQDDAALVQLGGIADVFLVHDRPIHIRCDDSVTRVLDDGRGGESEYLVRRSRGYAPQSIKLAAPCRCPMLAVGGQLKATFALGRGLWAFPSHHLGDLDHYEAYRAFERDVRLYEELFAIRPELIVHDLHPDYASTTYARRRRAAEGVPTVAVQHHHAARGRLHGGARAGGGRHRRGL